MPTLLAFPWPLLRRIALRLLLVICPVSVVQASPVLHQISSTVYQTEHCLFIIDASVTWASPQTAYNDIYAAGSVAPYFPRLQGYYDTLVANSSGQFFSVCYIANTGYSQVPNYIDRTYKADGINETYTAGTHYTYPTVDMCRYNLPGGNVTSPVLAVYDHELGHAWGARAFYTFGQPSLSDGHWLPNSTVDCQMSATYSPDGGVTVNKLYGDPVNGFRYRRVDNGRSNDFSVFSEQTLYLLGVRESWPTAYVLNNPVYNADMTAGSSSYLTFDHAGMLSLYGPRTPDYTTSQKQFKIGFVYIARDLAEVNTVYTNVENSANAFCNAEAIDTSIAYKSQTPFLCNTKYRASVDALLADLDGNATPTLAVTSNYVTSTDGSAVINFTAADADGPTPPVAVVPASTCCAVVGSTVQIAGLPDGVHFFTLRAQDAGGKKAFAHFTVEVHRPVTSTVIATQPLPATVTSGATASFSVVATGSPASFTYQWFRKAALTSTWNALSDGGAYSGSATATLLVATGTDQDGDNFLCLVTNATGSATSSAAELAVNEPLPSLTAQPADAAVPSGQSVPFTVAVIGAPTTYGYFHYQWQLSTDGGVNWSDLVNGAPYTSVTSATLHVQSTLAMSGNQFRCQVSNTAGAVTSNVASLTVGTVPVVTMQPVSVSTSAGQSASFSVVVSGSGPLSYQWSNYSTPVPGGTSATLTLTNVQASDIGAYTVFVTNAYGSTRSNVGTLAVAAAAPSFTAQPQDATVAAGQGVTFTATAAGTNPFTYQWKKNGAVISGATGSTYTINHVVAGDAGVYTVVVTNSVNSATSAGGTLTVTASGVPHDFNNDGMPDMMLENTSTGQRTLWLMNGTVLGSTISYGNIPPAWRIAATADFNHDAQIDIVWENTTTGDHAIWLMNGTVFSSAIDFGIVPTQWRLATVGDFNNDGDPDFFWENTVTGDRALWLMHGTVFSSAIFFGTVSTDWRIAAAGDFNGDGKPDLIWENTVTGQRALWLMNGTVFIGGASLGTVSTDWRIAATGDFDADGQTDIVWENTVTGQRKIWLMNGTVFSSSVDLGTLSIDWHIAD